MSLIYFLKPHPGATVVPPVVPIIDGGWVVPEDRHRIFRPVAAPIARASSRRVDPRGPRFRDRGRA